MHYAIVTETYPPEVNGVALTVQSLEGGLRARGHEVSLVRPRQDGATAADPGETLVRGVALPRYPGLRAGLPATGTLARAWSDSRPDAVYVATEGPLGWSALRAARRLGIPVATGFHTRFDEYMRDYAMPWLEPVALRWMRHFHNRADATLVPTRELESFLDRSGFERVRLLPRAVDTQLFDPARRDDALRAELDVGPGAPLLIHVGRIAAEKNLALAVRGFRRLQARRPDARYVWVGDGPMREALQRDNPDFVFTGIVRGEALARLFASADLFVFPSRSETFGNVTLEAMASGIATIAWDYGAAREHLRDGEHGAAIASGDEATFLSAVERIAGGDDAMARMREMGAAARGAVLGLSPQRVAQDFDTLLSGLCNGDPANVRRAAA
ncbi:glycosyltransferase family 1 protein [Luteimonas viscosa]|uniref:Glycosyltransferase family 1 protein n=1 Tax=Luteimonas viscosa TaxID=1132694 RepID=A0A5D4XND1_9GAMM|nr:glycosyltransferase family 1 protein [Luteimonas viscosa]TYT25443.1 glycosyltransferase family 1 protein [Luteimonas viscosa]